jgi:integrase-like protein
VLAQLTEEFGDPGFEAAPRKVGSVRRYHRSARLAAPIRPSMRVRSRRRGRPPLGATEEPMPSYDHPSALMSRPSQRHRRQRWPQVCILSAAAPRPAFPEGTDGGSLASVRRYLLRNRASRRRPPSTFEEVLTAPRSPWQNPSVERLIGSIRRECLDHVIIFNEHHLRHVLSSYFFNIITGPEPICHSTRIVRSLAQSSLPHMG